MPPFTIFPPWGHILPMRLVAPTGRIYSEIVLILNNPGIYPVSPSGLYFLSLDVIFRALPYRYAFGVLYRGTDEPPSIRFSMTWEISHFLVY